MDIPPNGPPPRQHRFIPWLSDYEPQVCAVCREQVARADVGKPCPGPPPDPEERPYWQD